MENNDKLFLLSCIMVVFFLLMMMTCTNHSLKEDLRPEVVILGIQKNTGIQGNEFYIVDYLYNTESRQGFFANDELVDRFVKYLEDKTNLLWLSAAE